MTEVEIDGVRFKFAPLPGRSGMRLAARVVKLLGPLMADAKDGDVTQAVAALATADENDVLGVADILGPVSQMEFEPGKWTHLTPAAQDAHFAGRPKLFLSWIGHCVKDQLSDFFA